jgi:hypothetical protein
MTDDLEGAIAAATGPHQVRSFGSFEQWGYGIGRSRRDRPARARRTNASTTSGRSRRRYTFWKLTTFGSASSSSTIRTTVMEIASPRYPDAISRVFLSAFFRSSSARFAPSKRAKEIVVTAATLTRRGDAFSTYSASASDPGSLVTGWRFQFLASGKAGVTPRLR